MLALKTPLVILFLVLFLFNTIGFYGVFVGLQLKEAQEANLQLDKNLYAESDMVTFKVPLSIPYSTDDQDFSRVTGEFEHEDEVYRLVKQKLYRDTLYVTCVKDNTSKKINEALNDYVKTFADKFSNTKQQGSKPVVSFIKDYLSMSVKLEPHTGGWNKCLSYQEHSPRYFSFYSSRIKYPPKSV